MKRKGDQKAGSVSKTVRQEPAACPVLEVVLSSRVEIALATLPTIRQLSRHYAWHEFLFPLFEALILHTLAQFPTIRLELGNLSPTAATTCDLILQWPVEFKWEVVDPGPDS